MSRCIKEVEMAQDKQKILTSMIDDNGDVSFFYDIGTGSMIDKVTASSFIEAQNIILKIVFFENYYLSFVQEMENRLVNLSEEEEAKEFIFYLYEVKVIDPFQYFYWPQMTNGLLPFMFRGRNHEEIMKSFLINYKKSSASEIESDQPCSLHELKNKLSNFFVGVLGFSYFSIGSLLDFDFVKFIPVGKLHEFKNQNIRNKYKRVSA